MSPQRKHLDDYTRAYRDLEITDAAIELLGRVRGTNGVIATLKRKQSVHLRRLDAAAAKLGAPYQEKQHG